MTHQVLHCPQCQGEVSFSSSRRFVQCAACGGNYVIRRDEQQQARLEPPGPALAESGTLTLRERIDSLELRIADLQEESQQRQAEVDATTTAYWRGRLGLQRVVSDSQNSTYVSGLVAAVAAFLTLFTFQSTERLYGAAIVALVILVGWAFHREWRSEEQLGQTDLAGAMGAVAEARAAYDASMNRLADLSCERSICVAISAEPSETTPA